MEWVIVVTYSLGPDCVVGPYESHQAASLAWIERVRLTRPEGCIAICLPLSTENEIAATSDQQASPDEPGDGR